MSMTMRVRQSGMGRMVGIFCLIYAMYEATISKGSTERLVQLRPNVSMLKWRRSGKGHTASAGHGSQAPNGEHIRLLAFSVRKGTERSGG